MQVPIFAVLFACAPPHCALLYLPIHFSKVPEAVQNKYSRFHDHISAVKSVLNTSHCNADLSIGGISTGVPALLPAILGPLVNLGNFEVVKVCQRWFSSVQESLHVTPHLTCAEQDMTI